MLVMPSNPDGAANDDGTDMCDSTEAAAALHMHPTTFRRNARLGLIPGATRIGGRWKMSRENIRRAKLGLPPLGDDPPNPARWS